MGGRYEIRKKIGHGGLGEVFVAFDTQLGREVALKRLKTTEETGKDDLFKEAKVLSALQHPNVVTLYDIGVDDQGPFAVMELLKGETLDRTVERGALTLGDFNRVVRQTLEGMIAAQAVGLLHRDIKPGNLMVIWLPSGKFQIKILDFGLATVAQQPSTQTSDQGDGIMGSIYFMAPEQFERLPLTPATDMYSLGCVYYFTLTQKHPFEGESPAQVMASHLRHDVPDLAALRPDLPPEVATWVMWLINRKPEDRPASAAEALDYFRAATDQAKALASREPPPVAAPQARRPVLVTGPAAAPAGLTVGDHTAQLVTGGPVGTQPPPLTAGPPAAPAGVSGPRPPLAGAGSAPVARVPGSARPVGQGGGFPKWALVTFPILLVALLGIAGWKWFQRGEQKARHEAFLRMFEEERPQGDAATVRDLVEYMREGGENGVAAAMVLIKLEGPGVAQEMVRQIERLRGDSQKNMVRALAMRGYEGAAPVLVKVARETDEPDVRLEALAALTETAGEKDLQALFLLMPVLRRDDERLALEEAILRVCRNRPTEELRTRPILDELAKTGDPVLKGRLMEIAGQLGGEAALAVIAGQLDAEDESVSTAAIRALSLWPTSAPAERLFAIASGGGDPIRREVALLGFVELAGSVTDLPMEDRVAMLERALEVARREEFNKAARQVFLALSNVPDPAAVALARAYVDDPVLGRTAAGIIQPLENALSKLVELDASGGVLPAVKAMLLGEDAEYASREDGRGVITNWDDRGTWIGWTLRLPEGGRFTLKIDQAAGEIHGGTFEVVGAGTSFREEVKRTGGEPEFTTSVLGELTFPKAGAYQLTIRPLALEGEELMVLRQAELERTGPAPE